MREYGQIQWWTDEGGVTRRVPTGKLQFVCPSHAAIRAFVYRRDDYQCRGCGARANPPEDYDGRTTLLTDRICASRSAKRYGWNSPVPLMLDHVVSRRNGGSNHPENLQALCEPCNAAKSVLVDRRHRRDGAHPLDQA
jgi:5-methylcytosine-specific restriction endonuclease McrA